MDSPHHPVTPDPVTPAHESPDPVMPPPVLVAEWFEHRLHESGAPFAPTVRLFGLELLDPWALLERGPTAVRVTFLAEATNEAELFAAPESAAVRDFDLVAIVTHPWLSRPGAETRPAAYASRRRARVVQVVAPWASATVARLADGDDVVVLAA
jgi:hypothetical protein